MRDAMSSLAFEAGTETDFVAEGAPGTTVTSGAAPGATGLTYLGRIGDGQWITNEAGIGMLTFRALPFEQNRRSDGAKCDRRQPVSWYSRLIDVS